jgi:2-polyprenyl-6-methoxyphenol hydroxylase-like FAD-dependent oxidoreductase
MASLCPPELAAWLRQGHAGLSAPTRLAVQVGLAAAWWRPGMLLLGDAAHPMSPVRAQGINMALRDAWVASVHLVPLLRSGATGAALDQVLATIEAERQPEITALQRLQAAEASRGEQLRDQAWLRCGLALAAPIVGPAVAAHWIHQQQPLRLGLAALPAPP